MPDISMCTNSFCLSKDYCYRFTAIPSKLWQSYADFNPKKGEDKCEDFWPNSKDSEKCKRNGVKKEGEICNLDQCNYPNCVKDDYCKYCHQINGVHKISCPTYKIQINL